MVMFAFLPHAINFLTTPSDQYYIVVAFLHFSMFQALQFVQYIVRQKSIQHISSILYLMEVHTLTPRRYNTSRVLANSKSRLQSSLSLALALQFLTPNFSASFVTPSIHLRFGLPARLLPSDLSKVIFLHGRLSCIRITCPVHLSLVILIVVTRSASSYKRYSSSLYLDLHTASSHMGP